MATDFRREAPRHTPTESLTGATRAVGEHVRSLAGLLPGPSDYSGLSGRWGKEFVAGATVGIVALPLALGFGVASGAGAAAGLITAIVAGVIAAVFGGSHLQVSGPTGAMTVVLLPVIAHYGVQTVPLLALMAGVMVVGMGLAGLGRAVDLISWPVVEGFTMGIGVIIFVQQIPQALGTPKGESESTMVASAQALLATDWTKAWAPLLLVGLVLAVHLALNRVKRNLPVALVAIVVATVVVEITGLPVARIGALPTSLPLPVLPGFDMRILNELLAPALAVAALAALESLLSSRVADGMAPDIERTNADRELLGQGLANIGSAVFGGLPATGAIARTAVNVRSGGRTRVAAIVHSLVLAAVVLAMSPLVARIPLAALAGVLMWTAMRMVNLTLARRILSTTRADRTTFLLTLGATVVFDLVFAVLMGVAMAAIMSLRHMASYSTVRREHLPVSTSAGLIDFPNETLRSQVAVFRVDGALFYGDARRFVETVGEVDDVHGVIVRVHRMNVMDASGAEALKEVVQALARRRVPVVVQGMTDSQLRTATTLGSITPDQHAERLPEAIDLIERAIARVVAEDSAATVRMFSYGTLCQPEVQQATYGRLLTGVPDVLPGYALEWLKIDDPTAVALAGSDQHAAVRRTDDPEDAVAGMRFEISQADLTAADDFLTDDFVRLWEELESGMSAWVYVDRAFAHAGAYNAHWPVME